MANLEAFHKKIRNYLKAAGYTQKAFAEECGYSSPYFSGLINGKENITPQHIVGIVEKLAVKKMIQTQQQAQDLFELLDCENAAEIDWLSGPLSQLKKDRVFKSKSSTASSDTSDRPENLIRNGNFNHQLEEWRYDLPTDNIQDNSYSFEPFSNGFALKINHSGAGMGRVWQEIDIPEGTLNLKFSAHIKAAIDDPAFHLTSNLARAVVLGWRQLLFLDKNPGGQIKIELSFLDQNGRVMGGIQYLKSVVTLVITLPEVRGRFHNLFLQDDFTSHEIYVAQTLPKLLLSKVCKARLVISAGSVAIENTQPPPARDSCKATLWIGNIELAVSTPAHLISNQKA